jgi:DNA-binding IclR family transcriptional regulator
LATDEALMRDLQATRERGFAMSVQEHEVGINAVAAPILDVAGYPIAAIAVAGPSFRLTESRMLEIAPSIRVVADAIAREVGSDRVWNGLPKGK